ncbi:hypothetical protein Kpho02_41060 [Kitasatospora phosalacinea]|uniref:Uncharacterized protein n=1 Tax=Kitasatospora phosalacinea TaxID=2065 RepID=A0A9W6V418_9ACTN|nr:hypothetical protein Kpho02_41060 [Kitasatospora phosalacinea]
MSIRVEAARIAVAATAALRGREVVRMGANSFVRVVVRVGPKWLRRSSGACGWAFVGRAGLETRASLGVLGAPKLGYSVGALPQLGMPEGCCVAGVSVKTW